MKETVSYFKDKNTKKRVTRSVVLGEAITPQLEHIFSFGQCHALAVALHEILGWDSVTRVKSVRRCKVNGVFVGGFQARLTHLGREIYLGAYDTIEEAVKVRDEVALKLHGEFYTTGE